MGSYEVDFDDYEEKEGGYTGEVPKKGIYDGELVSLKEHTSQEGNEGFEWIFEITEGPYEGWRGWAYSNLDSTKWKTQQIVKAISGGKEKLMKITTAEDGKSSTVKKAKSVRLMVRTEMWDDERRAKLQTVLPNEDVSGGGGEDSDEPTGGKKKKKKDKKEDPF